MEICPWVLFVDDEERVLDGIELSVGTALHDGPEPFELITATSGQRALELLASRPGCAVVVSDMRMPQMDGAELLGRVRREYPDTARILLTGFADIDVAAAAVNEGQLFRFLTKPCPAEELVVAARAGLEHHRLRVVERDLLEQTLRGAVQLLVDVLALTSPVAFERASSTRSLVEQAAERLGWHAQWEVPMAALLARLGWMAVPPATIDRFVQGLALDPLDEQLLDAAPAAGARLLRNVPRLDAVADLVEGAGCTDPPASAGPTGLIRAALALDLAVQRGASHREAVAALPTDLDRELVQALAQVRAKLRRTVQRVRLNQLRPGMELVHDVSTTDGRVLIRQGSLLTALQISRVANFARGVGVSEPIDVAVHR